MGLGDFSDITLHENFDEVEAETLSPEDWAAAVIKRLPRNPRDYEANLDPVTTADPSSPAGMNTMVRASLIRKLARAIPDELRTRSVAEKGDLRALLFRVMGGPESDEELTVGDVTFDGRERRFAAAVHMDLMQSTYEGIYNGVLAALPEDPLDPEGINKAEKADELTKAMVEEYRGGVLHMVNFDRTGADGEVKTDRYGQPIEPIEEENDFFAELDSIVGGTTNERRTQTRFLSDEEFQELFQRGDLDLNDAYNLSRTGMLDTLDVGLDPTEGGAEILRGRPRVLYSDQETDRTRLPDEMPGGPWTPAGRELDAYSGKDWYSVSDILRKPYEMTRQELMTLHEKFKQAGIYDRTGGEPTHPGDPSDSRFIAAWKELATMSLSTGESMTSLLTSRAEAYQAEVEASLGTALSDPARIRMTADGYARQTLGRHLSAEEHARLAEFVHDLERRNARTEAGLDPDLDSDVDLDEGIIADVDARLQDMIRDENPVEAEAHDMADTYEMFQGMLRGPGRGI